MKTIEQSKIRTMVVEDNIESRDYLISLLKTKDELIEIVCHSGNIQGTLKKIKSKKPELIFMDIELKDGSAFDILDAVSSSDFEVVFVTAHDNYLEKAMEHYAFQYILKPVNLTVLEKVIEKYAKLKERMFSLTKYALLTEFLKNHSSKLMIHVNNQYVMVDLSEIIKCEAEGNLTYFYLVGNKRLLVSKALKYYDELLETKSFFRAHRSVLVNIQHIKSIYKREALILSNNERVVVSQRKKSNLLFLINTLS